MIDDSYDLAILGGGAAAFAAITEASRRNLTAAIVNDGLPLGGTCVNVGCVPSKRLLAVAETAFEPPRTPFDSITYDTGEPAFDWCTAVAEKDALVDQLRRENYINVAEHYNTAVYEGHGRFTDTTTIEINSGPNAGNRIEAEKVLVAAGSSPWTAPIDGLDAIEYETSESILTRRELPETMIVLGGGYVALEWGQILHRVGVDVTLLQRSDRLLSSMEGQLGREIKRCFEEEGFEVITGNDFRRVRTSDVVADSGVSAEEHQMVVETEVNGTLRTFDAEELFVATGVRPNTDGIGLERISVEVNDTGAVAVDDHYRTANPDVYAAGDVIGEPMLETIAAKEGNHAVQNAFGDVGLIVDYRSVPKVVF